MNHKPPRAHVTLILGKLTRLAFVFLFPDADRALYCNA